VEFAHVSFARGAQRVLHDVSFAVTAGETVVLVGRSGAGKSTILKLINRMLLPDAGQVVVDGRTTTEWNPFALRRGIGYVLQDVGLPSFRGLPGGRTDGSRLAWRRCWRSSVCRPTSSHGGHPPSSPAVKSSG
jgi:ABC-type siderophore export system fused ATPase/permease subunit